MQEVVFQAERSTVVSASGRDADRLGLAVTCVSGDERQEGHPEEERGEPLLLMILCECSYIFSVAVLEK